MEVVASLSQGRTAAAQGGLFTHKSVPVIFEPPCTSCFLYLASDEETFCILHLSHKQPDVYMVKYFLGFNSHCKEKQTFPFTNISYKYLRKYLRKMSDVCVPFNRNWNVWANSMASLM